MRTQPEQLLGARVTGSDGKVIGTVEQVFRDDVDGTATWARVRSGKTARFVPLGTSQVTPDGLSVPFDSPTVMNGPSIEAGQHMSAAQAEELSRYYGLIIPAQQAPRDQAPRDQAPGQQAAPSRQFPAQQAPSQQGYGMPAGQDAAEARAADRDSGGDVMMRTQAEQLLGGRVTGSDGKVIGTIEQVFRDDVDGTPAWARVRSGKTSRFVPLGTSQVTGEGLRVPFDSPTVVNGPDMEAGQHMSAAQCEELSRYYGLFISAQQAPREQAPREQAPRGQAPGQQAPYGQVPAPEVPSQQGAEQLLGTRVTGSDGKEIGTVEQVFRDDADGTPAWARIRSTRIVPLGSSQVTGEGLRLPFDSPTVMNGPAIEAGQHMSAAQAEQLSRYYGLIFPAQQAPAPEVPSQQGAEQLLGGRVTCSDGNEIGTVELVFWDDVDGTPAWARVRSGETSRFVPLGTSHVTGEGLRLPFDSRTVMNSPDIDASQHMSAAQAGELRRYYGLPIPAQQAPRDQAPREQAPGQQPK